MRTWVVFSAMTHVLLTMVVEADSGVFEADYFRTWLETNPQLIRSQDGSAGDALTQCLDYRLEQLGLIDYLMERSIRFSNVKCEDVLLYLK